MTGSKVGMPRPHHSELTRIQPYVRSYSESPLELPSALTLSLTMKTPTKTTFDKRAGWDSRGCQTNLAALNQPVPHRPVNNYNQAREQAHEPFMIGQDGLNQVGFPGVSLPAPASPLSGRSSSNSMITLGEGRMISLAKTRRLVSSFLHRQVIHRYSTSCPVVS